MPMGAGDEDSACELVLERRVGNAAGGSAAAAPPPFSPPFKWEDR